MLIDTESNSIAIDGGRVVSFRPACDEDERFLLDVYSSTRAEELALTNWDEHQRHSFLKMQFDAQHIHYRGQYPAAQYLIVLLNDVPVGRLYLAEKADEVRILDITVLPQHRAAGIGSAIVKNLMPMATSMGKPLGIYVEGFNRSLGLFERLGFVKSGENGYSFLMRWSAESEAGGQVSGARGTA
jgi:GNAT superfamily N-acetyltransferase